jgi:hypothetical protein
MKIALCFHGLPRLLRKCYPDIKKYFLDGNECDIYAHFWWDDSYKGKINRPHIIERFDDNENPIDTFIELYKPKKIIYEKCINIETHNKILDFTNLGPPNKAWRKIVCSMTIYCIFSKHASMLKSFQLIDDNDNYDVIINLRPDILMFKEGTFMNDFKFNNIVFNNNLYSPSSLWGGPHFGGEHPNRRCDWFIMGDKPTMNKFLNKSYEIISNSQIKIPCHIQERIIFFCEHAQIASSLFNCHISVRRYIVEEWEDPSYRLNHMLPENFNQSMYDEEKDCFKESALLPFYIENIKTLTSYLGNELTPENI